ncbi:MAG: helix-turn-helix transcriptional regulator [Parvibaculum sp.]
MFVVMRYDATVETESDLRALTLGAVVELLRQSRGWSQSELAKQAKVTQATISRIEKGMNEPSPQVRRQVAGALGMPAWDLERIVEAATTRAREKAGMGSAGEGQWWHGLLKTIAIAGLIGLIIWAVASVLTDEGKLEPAEED